ncbi:hypothetical protein B0H63DRAFT_179696 [Podospora didyma]|uniref:Uncharacterized protein n=1 Tax=Podospora didyma TaxID=330526 RepID=A0AAE0NP68_9PEZI|nr:hypothetical protein B0H63DRAFT_179696 [Podospora didyma]
MCRSCHAWRCLGSQPLDPQNEFSRRCLGPLRDSVGELWGFLHTCCLRKAVETLHKWRFWRSGSIFSPACSCQTLACSTWQCNWTTDYGVTCRDLFNGSGSPTQRGSTTDYDLPIIRDPSILKFPVAANWYVYDGPFGTPKRLVLNLVPLTRDDEVIVHLPNLALSSSTVSPLLVIIRWTPV